MEKNGSARSFLTFKGGDLNMNHTEQKVFDNAAPIVEKLNFKLIEVEFVKEGKDHFLRLYLDKKGGITLEDCAAASEVVSEKLDELEIIKRSEEHTSELQSRGHLVCRLLLEKKKLK